MVTTGTDKKGDVLVRLQLTEQDSINLELNSKVYLKYGESIERSVLETLREFGIDSADIKIDDYGALDFVIRARVETAIVRALGGK